MTPTPDTLLAFASGIPLAVLGVVLVSLRAKRPEAVFFGSFSLLWGFQVLSSNLGRVLENADAHVRGYLAGLAVMPAASILLVHVATRSSPGRAARLVTPLVATTALAAAAAIWISPRLVVESVTETPAGITTAFGPAVFPLFFAPFFGAIYLAIISLYFEYRAQPPGTARHRVRALLLALTLFGAYYGPRNFFLFVSPPATFEVAQGYERLARLGFYGALTASVLLLALHLHLRPASLERRDKNLIATLLVPAGVAAGEYAAASAGIVVDTAGVWRLLAVAALAYALARRQIFDLELRLRRLAGTAIAALFLVTGAVLAALVTASGDAPAALTPLLAGVILGGGTWLARDRVGVLLVPRASEEPDYIRQRKLEVYRGALERAIAVGEPLDSAEMKGMRKGLGIAESEHMVMEFMVKQRGASGMLTTTGSFPRVEQGARVLDRYRVSRLLGEGAFGRAYLAFDEKLDREVVVKAVGTMALGGRGASMLLREARLAASIQHNNVIAVYDIVEGPYEATIVMEYADGGNLAGFLRRKGRATLEEAVSMLDQILQALEAAHTRGIVHRDIKPENILLTAKGKVKIADFGVARDTRPEATGLLTGVVGTLLYMSPEQVRGAAVDQRSDLYSAAVVFHESIEGRLYLDIAGCDDFQLRRMILESPPALGLEDQPAWIRDLLEKALEKEPDGRFADAAEMRAALRVHVPGLAA